MKSTTGQRAPQLASIISGCALHAEISAVAALVFWHIEGREIAAHAWFWVAG
jgi:hypothetical protein